MQKAFKGLEKAISEIKGTEMKLSDVCKLIVDCPHSTAKDEGTGYPLIRTPNIGRGRLKLDGVHRVSENVYLDRNQRATPQTNDLILAREAPVGNVAVIKDEKVCLGQRTVLIRPDEKKVDADFLVYYLLAPKQQHLLLSASNGATVSHLNMSAIRNLEIDLPEMNKQKRMGRILSKLDDLIVENERINKNLEAQAQAYFIDQFVVNADPTWPQGTLSDLGTVVGGGTPSKKHPEYYCEHGIPWITPKDLSVDKSKFISHGENDISDLGFSNSSATKMPEGTILFSSRAPIGYIAIASNTVTTNQGFKSIIPNTNVGTAFVYYFLKQALPTIEGMASGSTFKEISGSGMKSVPAVIPDNETLHKFSEFCKPLFKQQAVMEAENRRLSGIRDALLPKLMSGEIDVSDIDL